MKRLPLQCKYVSLIVGSNNETLWMAFPLLLRCNNAVPVPTIGLNLCLDLNLGVRGSLIDMYKSPLELPTLVALVVPVVDATCFKNRKTDGSG